MLAHHSAEVNGAFAGLVARLGADETCSPKVSWDDIHRANAGHARANADVDRPTVLALLRERGGAVGRALRALGDDDLDRVAGTFGGNELTIAQVIEYVVIGHTAEHLARIRATTTQGVPGPGA